MVLRGIKLSFRILKGGTAHIKPHSSGSGYAVHYQGTETVGHHRSITEAQASARKYVGLEPGQNEHTKKAYDAGSGGDSAE